MFPHVSGSYVARVTELESDDGPSAVTDRLERSRELIRLANDATGDQIDILDLVVFRQSPGQPDLKGDQSATVSCSGCRQFGIDSSLHEHLGDSKAGAASGQVSGGRGSLT